MNRSLDGLTAKDYTRAILALGVHGLTDTRRRMLTAHYRSGGRALSARQMGLKMGWPTPSTSNMHYGRLGGLIAGELGMPRNVQDLFRDGESACEPRKDDFASMNAATDKVIRDKKPESYSPVIAERAGAEAFSARCIPTEPSLLPLEN